MPARTLIAAAAIAAFAAVSASAADTSAWPNYREDDCAVKNYAFKSGESLPEVKIQYRSLGRPKKDASGAIVNGVLLLQGNTGTGANWLRPTIADELFKPGQPLDPAKYFIIMPDALG